jgi:Flp pilus assembly protein TadG
MASMRNRSSIRLVQTARGRRSGHSVLEVALLSPWIFFLFIGALDWGFFSYALLSTQSAARVATLYTSSSNATAADQAAACQYVLDELRRLPNIGTAVQSCSSLPVIVTAQRVDQNSNPPSADRAPASRVTVTYQTVPLIPIPGLLPGQLTITHSAEMRIRG